MLTPEEKIFLHEAEHDQGLLRERVRFLRKRGRTIREIATEINRSPSTVGYWSQSALIGVVQPPQVKTAVKRRYVEVPSGIDTYLRKLAKSAKRANRHSEYWSNDAAASRELNMMLWVLHHERMVPMTTLAHICGISTSAVSQRLKDQPRVGD